MVISRLKILNGTSMEFLECLNEDIKNKKDTFCTKGVGPFIVLPVPTCLILHKYEFMDSVMI